MAVPGAREETSLPTLKAYGLGPGRRFAPYATVARGRPSDCQYLD